VIVCFDWDCTMSERHMHKDTKSKGGMHSTHMLEWCEANGVDSRASRAGLSARERLDFGADTERVVVEYFFGGLERIKRITGEQAFPMSLQAPSL
jgi:hypothetical protein